MTRIERARADYDKAFDRLEGVWAKHDAGEPYTAAESDAAARGCDRALARLKALTA